MRQSDGTGLVDGDRGAEGDLTLEPVTRKVKRGDRRIDLTAREFSLLEYMLRNRGRVLSRSQIMDAVWDDPCGDSNVGCSA